MSERNCPNCGAPIDIETNKCSYCGTSYFDLSCINFEEYKPMYLKIKINNGGTPCYVTQKVIPMLGDITVNYDTADVVDYKGNVVKKFMSNKTITTNIHFEAISDNGNLMTMQLV